MKPPDTTLSFWRAETGAEDTRSPNALLGLMLQVDRGASGLSPSLAALLNPSEVSCDVPLPFRLSPNLGLILVALSLLVGCGHKEGDGHDHAKVADRDKGGEHGHGHDEESPSGASFKAGRGVIVTEETRKLLGVHIADVTNRKVPNQIRFTMQVFGEKHHHLPNPDDHTACDVHGSSFLALNIASAVKVGQPVELLKDTNSPLGGIVLAVQTALALGESEVVIGVSNATAVLKSGEFVQARINLLPDVAVMAVPQSALLRTSEGTFVYAINGDAFFRTAVKVGAEADGWVEISDGLLEGDQVATKPVQTLWLIELRATRGGGHSH